MVKILLVNPTSLHTQKSAKPTLYLPLGILYVAGVLENAGHKVEVYDAKASCQINNVGNHIHFGDSWEKIEKRLEKSDYNILGITCPFTILLNQVLKIAQISKKVKPNVPVIVGGPHATVCQNDFLKSGFVDYICPGEGEKFIVEFLKNMSAEKSYVENLDEIPFPAYHKIDMEVYLSGKYVPRSEITSRALPMITSRGCPFSCSFCSVNLQFGKRWRGHSVDYIISHIKSLKEKYGVKLIHLEDDNISADKERFENLLDRLIEENIDIHFDTPNGVRLDTLDENILRKCKKAKFDYLVIAPESGSQRVLDEVIGKNLDLKKAEEVAKICKKIGLNLEAFYVVGSPGETKEEMEHTFRFAKMMWRKYKVFPLFDRIAPLPGTRLWKLCEEKNYFSVPPTPENLLTSQHGKSIIQTPEFSPSDIENLFKKYKWFLLWVKIWKAICHPQLLKSWVRKIIAIRKI